MQMRIVRGRVRPGTWSEYEQAYKAVIKEIGSVPGLKARWLVRDESERDSGFSVSVWDDARALREYERGGLLKDTIAQALKPFFVGDFTVSHCEVVHAEETAGRDSA